MLFPKPLKSLEYADIVEFCKIHDEGIRVEYKRSFDEVRATIAKSISAFANQFGGTIIFGVAAPEGKPTFPIEGFQKKSSEEIRLTIQNICRDAIYPALLPEIREIPIPGSSNVIVVVDIDQSVEAPHAIENSERVYLRTGSSSNPHKLSDIDTLEQLLKRRNQPLRLREEFFSDAMKRFSNWVNLGGYPPILSITHTPLLPHRPIISLNELFTFLTVRTINLPGIGTFIFSPNSWRRINHGITHFHTNYYIQINDHGFIQLFYQLPLTQISAQDTKKYLLMTSIVEAIGVILQFSHLFFQRCHYFGNLEMEISIMYADRVELVLGRNYDPALPPNQSLDSTAHATHRHAFNGLTDPTGIISELVNQLFWCFNQLENSTAESFSQFVETTLKDLNLLRHRA